MSDESYSIVLCSRTRLLTPGHTNPHRIEAIQTKATKVKQTEAATRIKPKISATASYYMLRFIH